MPLAALHRASVTNNIKAGFQTAWPSHHFRVRPCASRIAFHRGGVARSLICSAAEDNNNVIMMEQTIPVSVATEFMGVCMKTATQLVAQHSPSGLLVGKVETAAASIQEAVQSVADDITDLNDAVETITSKMPDWDEMMESMPDWDELKEDLETAVGDLSDLSDIKGVMIENHEAVSGSIKELGSNVEKISSTMESMEDNLSSDVSELSSTLFSVQLKVADLGSDVVDVEELLQDEIKPELEAMKEMMKNLATKQEVAKIKSDLAELKASMAAVLNALTKKA